MIRAWVLFAAMAINIVVAGSALSASGSVGTVGPSGFSRIATPTGTVRATQPGDTVNLVEGEGITLTPDQATKSVTITSTASGGTIVNSTTCEGTEKIRAFNSGTGLFTCAPDQTGAAGSGISSVNGANVSTQSIIGGDNVTVSTDTDTGIHTISATGLTGAQGIQGEVGPQGIQGVQGIQGLQGVEGPQGPAGAKGDKGDQGDVGPMPTLTDSTSTTDSTVAASATAVKSVQDQLNGLGTAAATDAGDYATAAQGTRAEGAQRGTTLIICAAQAKNTLACDYVCDRANDEVQFQAAHDALPSYGGEIVMSEGLYAFGADFNITNPNVTVRGVGDGSAIYPTAPDLKLFNVQSGTTARTYGKRFSNLKFYTNTATSPTVAGNGSTVTVTTGAAHGYTTGNQVWMRGWTGGAGVWNGVYSVTVTDSTHFTYAATGSGTATGGKVGYTGTAIYSYRSSQQYMTDISITGFSRAIYAEEAWDHFQTRVQIFESGAGDDYQTAGVVLRNGIAGGDQVAGYLVEGGRHESWLAGTGTQYLLDGLAGGTAANNNIKFVGNKFEYYTTKPVIKGDKTAYVQINNNSFSGNTSNTIDIDSNSYAWQINNNSFAEFDASGRGQVSASVLKTAAADVLFSGNMFNGNNNNTSTPKVTILSGASNTRITGNHTSYSGTVWKDDAGTGTSAYLNTFEENLTGYELLTASDTVLGGVKVDGTSITIADGVISAPNTGSGSVTSVGLSLPSEFSITGSPVTATGSLTGAWADQTTGKAFMAPNGSTGTPTFRAIAAADLGTTMTPQFGAIGANAAADAAGQARIYAWGSTGNGVKGGTSSGIGVLGTASTTGTGFQAQSAYGYALLATQYVATMTQSTAQPDVFIQRNLTLTGGYTALHPVLRVENAVATSSASYGPLIEARKGSTAVFQINDDGTAIHNGSVTAKQFVDTALQPTVSAGSVTIDLAAGMDQEVVTAANTTITLPAPVAGKSYTITVKYGGTHTITWAGGSTIRWSGGSAPIATSVSGKYDVYVFKSDATSTYTMGFDGGRNI